MPVWVHMNDAPNNLVVRQVIRHAAPLDAVKPDLAAQFVSYPDGTVVEPGWIDQQNGSFAPPPPPPPDAPMPVPAVISRIDFMQLFTIAEQAALREQADIPRSDVANFDGLFHAFWEMLHDPQMTTVDLGKEITENGVDYLETVGLIGPGRAGQILGNEPPPPAPPPPPV